MVEKEKIWIEVPVPSEATMGTSFSAGNFQLFVVNDTGA